MTGVELVGVDSDEDGLRLDRWFRRHYPDVHHGLLEKWLRLGYVRIDGRRAKAGDRLSPGQMVRVPPQPVPGNAPTPRRPQMPVAEADTRALRASILHMDDAIIAIDKPAGLAVQGGSKVHRHLDAMLDALKFGGERPRLVHRLDKDTSGVLVLARTAGAAAKLTAAFRSKTVRKLYWAIVVGSPPAPAGRIVLPLAKHRTADGERMVVDEVAGDSATTAYRVVDRTGRQAAWLALEPLTGRTHQLRVHCAALGTPILGDGKYGGDGAHIAGSGLDRRLHLLAQSIRLPHPAGGEVVVRAPMPSFMAETWKYLGFSPTDRRGEMDSDDVPGAQRRERLQPRR